MEAAERQNDLRMPWPSTLALTHCSHCTLPALHVASVAQANLQGGRTLDVWSAAYVLACAAMPQNCVGKVSA